MKRIYSLNPDEREKECTDHAWSHIGNIPCTGPQVCMHCGTRKEEHPPVSVVTFAHRHGHKHAYTVDHPDNHGHAHEHRHSHNADHHEVRS